MREIIVENGWLLDLDEANLVDGNDVRLYRDTVILAYLEGAYEGAELVECNPTPVHNEEGKVLGYAMVRVQNRKLVADIVIDYASPERLAAETRDGVRHYARAVGSVAHKTRGDGILDFMRPEVSKVEIDNITLTSSKPNDPKVLPLGEPILL